MYKRDDYIELKDYAISAVLFDDAGFFAGFKFIDQLTKEVLYDQPVRTNKKRLSEQDNHEELILGTEGHTRIVGFRTTKACESSKRIMSLQPIYYSLDRRMCTEVLKSPGLLEEI